MENKISEGEEFIADFLKFYDIKFESEVQINNLKGDSKQHRIADFYIPKYKIYIEFFGKWNTSPDEKARYTEKRGVYSKNNIPCIYFYPENLGILPFVFDKRLQKTLEDHKLNKELRKYHIAKLFKGEQERMFVIAFCIFILSVMSYDIQPQYNLPAILGGISIIGYQLIKLTIAYFKIFIFKKYPLKNLD